MLWLGETRRGPELLSYSKEPSGTGTWELERWFSCISPFQIHSESLWWNIRDLNDSMYLILTIWPPAGSWWYEDEYDLVPVLKHSQSNGKDELLKSNFELTMEVKRMSYSSCPEGVVINSVSKGRDNSIEKKQKSQDVFEFIKYTAEETIFRKLSRGLKERDLLGEPQGNWHWHQCGRGRK